MFSLRVASIIGSLLLICGARPISAQNCACSPSTYEFTFDFSLTCPRPGGDYPPGIAEVTCFVTSFSTDVQDLTPVSVQTVSIIEADVDRVPIAQNAIDGDFVSGDSFTYNSVAALGDSEQIPQSIQLTITGTNAANFSLVQVWAIKFTNDCDIYPVLELGQTYGWTEFTGLGTPQSSVCPAVESLPVPTVSPTFTTETVGPTPLATVEGDNPLISTPEPTLGKRTPEPTPLATDAATTSEPTILPTMATPEPTITTTPEPTIMETDQPTSEPTVSPVTDEPTIVPVTSEPTASPQESTKAPKGGGKGQEPDDIPPTIRPTIEYTSEPTKQPSFEPTSYEPTSYPPTEPPKIDDPSDEELEEPTDMSFSYAYDVMDEDFEWGRSGKSKAKSKKDKKDHDSDVREHMRLGGRSRLRR